MNKKQLQKNSGKIIRFCIQLIFFITMSAAFTSAFAGVKYIFTQIGIGQKLELTAFVISLIALCGFTIIFGRFFCGFACAFGSLGDWMYAFTGMILKKMKKKRPVIKESIRTKLDYVKYIVLIVIAGLCFLQVYGSLRGSSPWDVFSMLKAGKTEPGGYIVGTILLVLIAMGMCVQERFFCRFFCPMGAIFSLLPMLPAFSLFRSREQCMNRCSACERQCPADIKLADDGQQGQYAGCFQCQKCIGICPKKNTHTGIKILRGNEWWWTLLRAILLFVLLSLVI